MFPISLKLGNPHRTDPDITLAQSVLFAEKTVRTSWISTVTILQQYQYQTVPCGAARQSVVNDSLRKLLISKICESSVKMSTCHLLIALAFRKQLSLTISSIVPIESLIKPCFNLFVLRSFKKKLSQLKTDNYKLIKRHVPSNFYLTSSKAPVMTAAEDIHKYFFVVFQRK